MFGQRLDPYQQDMEDAQLFRLWIKEAAERPCRLASAICHCVTPDDYRKVLRGFRTATDIEDKFHATPTPPLTEP